MPIATEQEAAARYQEWRQRYREELRRGAEAATLGKVRGGAAVGRLPLGYEYGRDGTVQVDPCRERLLREAFLLAAEGGGSVREILADVTRGGLRGRSGKALDASQLWRVLTSPFYAGMVAYRDLMFPGRHQPLVSAETFRKAQESLDSRSKRRNKSPRA